MNDVNFRFGMFTVEGNQVINDLVDFANANKLEWNVVRDMMKALSKDNRFEECMDTAVREAVYESVNSENHRF